MEKKLEATFVNRMNGNKNTNDGAVAVAQLVEQLLPTRDSRGSNPVIDKFIFIINCKERTKKLQRVQEWHNNKKTIESEYV